MAWRMWPAGLLLVPGSGMCQRALASWGGDISMISVGLAGQKRIVEERWRQFFSDPSQWWDHRLDKTSTRYPDFRHMKTREGLWVEGKSNPKWVEAELSAMVPGTVTRNPFALNVLLAKHVKDGHDRKALDLFKQLQREGMKPDLYTFVPVLNACTTLGALEEGRDIHALIIENACETDVYVGTSLLHMYVNCECLEDAKRVFAKLPVRTVVSWNAMIRGFVKCGKGQKALDLYQQMQLEKVKPDAVTFVGILTACASLAELEAGRLVHEQIIDSGWLLNRFVRSSLVDMYSKCGSIADAWNIFSKMPTIDLVAWNSMIGGYVRCGAALKALELFQQMSAKGVQPDSVTFVAALNACASLAALEEGRYVEAKITESSCETNVFVRNALVDMYAKCGSIEDALRVFSKMPTWDAVAWNSMLGGYATHGQVKKACELFEQMCREGVKLNSVTFICLLSVCSHTGFVDEGLHYLEAMTSQYQISIIVDHYACIADLLGRAGRLHEAEDMIRRMPCEPDAVVWKALLATCRMHGNVWMGERIAKIAIDMDPDNVSSYTLLSNIYASAGEWDSTVEVHNIIMGSV